MKKLSQSQQMAMLKALPAHRKNAVKAHCVQCSMRGQGIGDILKTIGSVLGPIISEISPSVLKKFILPFIKKKMAGKGMCGKGLRQAGNGILLSGAGLVLAGAKRGRGLKA